MVDHTGMGQDKPTPRLVPNCQCVCHRQPGAMHVAVCCRAPSDPIPRAEADAMVAAALRMAAEKCREEAWPEDGTYAPHERNIEDAERATVEACRSAILSLTPADAAAALDEVRREAHRAARQLAGLWSAGEGPNIDPTSARGLSAYEQGWLDAIAHAQKQIAALEEPK